MKVRKGSFTIEAACVMSLVLITVMGVLYLSFFVHNRSWLTAAAYEAALAGSIEGVQKNGQIYEAASAKAPTINPANVRPVSDVHMISSFTLNDVGAGSVVLPDHNIFFAISLHLH